MQLEVANRLLLAGSAQTGIDKATETASKSLLAWNDLVKELYRKIDFDSEKGLSSYEMGIHDSMAIVKRYIREIEGE